MSAIRLMPGIVVDSADKPIPIPITRSYSEGLDTFGYWSAAHGARSGSIKKSVSTSMPGWLTKDLINSVYETRINSDTPVDANGLEYNVEDKKGILNRYLARDIKDSGGKIIAKRNDLVNSDVVSKMNQHGIKNLYVQSPLTDPTPGDGFSSYSYGADYDGKRNNIGDNIGIKSAHTITESSTNMALKAFHTGGAIQIGKKATGTLFDQLFNTLKFSKNNPDKATVASINGVVKDIKKSPIGGWDIHLSDGKNDEIRYVDANNEPIVKPRTKVSAGDLLSTGTPSAHDILKYKGMPETQKFLVNHIDGLMDGKLDKRDIETIVRGITNTTRIMDPGTHPNFIKGDVAPLSTIEHYNSNNKKEEDVSNILGDHLAKNYGSIKANTKIDESILEKINKMGYKRVDVFKDRIKHEPFLTPNGIGAKGQVSEDWIARLAHSRIAKVLEEGTTQGWRTDITPTSNPITQYVTGVYNS
jgi:DNA-directed RNA polymerase subunit beta'